MKKSAGILMAAAVLSLTACADKKTTETETTTTTDSIVAPVDNTAVETDTLTTTETQAPVHVTVKGTVTGIQQGKDGYTAEIKDDAGATYLATISIPNLKDPKQYRAVKAGDVITVKGESWKMEDGLHIKAEELN